MRVLIVTQYFWPESFIVNELVRRMAEAGHSMVVATGKPNYPSGQLAPGYTRHRVQHERFGEAEVIRIPCRPRYQTSALNLSLNYLSFAWSGLLRFPRLLRRHDFDVVLVFAMPITAALPAILLSWIKRRHLALWVQDLWPDVVTSTGFVRSRLVLNAVRILAKCVYRAADTILVQSNDFVEPLAKTTSAEKIFVLPNFAPSVVEEEVLALPTTVQQLLHGRFSIVFAGNLGGAQSLFTILDAARILQHQPDILIVVAGAGSQAEALRHAIADAALANVVLIGMLDRRMMPELFRRADCLLVTLGNHPALNATVPSKVQSYLKAGRPIVGAVNGAAANLIEAAGAGITVQAEDGAGLAQSILKLFHMSAAKRTEMGRAGRAYYEQNFDAERMRDRLVEVLQSRMGCHE